MSPRMLRRGRCVAAALALTGTLAACGGLPTTGPVVEGRRLGESIQEPVRVSAQGPRTGDTQEGVVRGFITAGEDSDETHQTGKEFLAPPSLDLWRWSSQDVIVYDSLGAGLATKRLTHDTVQATVVAVARVTPDGRYVELPAGSVVTARFTLTKIGAEWRIQLPATGFGLWIDSGAFERLYTNRLVHYVTPAGRRLVPDSRWFPSGTTLTTALARAQLDPVPPYLEGAVTTGVPPKTTLNVNAVPVDESGRAVVDLSAAALEADPDKRTAMWAQLTATLSQVTGPAVKQVSLAAEGASLELPTGRTSVGSASELGFTVVPTPVFDTALVRQGDTLRRINPVFVPEGALGQRLPDTKPLDTDVRSIPQGWTNLGLSADGREVAAADNDTLSLWRATEETVRIAPFATRLTRPAYDATGYLWVSGLDDGGSARVFVLNPTGSDQAPTPVAVPAPWLAGRRVVSLTVSPDGARLLVVTTRLDGTDPQLGVSGIQRSPNGAPTGLATPLREARPLTLIRDAVWISSMSYAVIGRLTATEPVRPWLGTIGSGLDGVRRRGTPDPADNRLATVPDARSITSVGGPRGLIVITDDGRVLARSGASWRKIGEGTDLLVPGR